MALKQDPLGQAVQDYWQSGEPADIVVESNLAPDDVIPVAYLFRSESEMPEPEKIALHACRGAVLDLGAGAGAHSLVLQQRGFEVTALELSEGAAAVMKERGVKDVQQADLWQWQPDRQYDTLLLLMNGIGLAGSLDGLQQFLARVKDWLKPGGQILLESADLLYMYEDDDGSVLIDLNGPYYGEVKYRMKYKQLATDEFDWLFIDPQTLEDHAEAAGFRFEMLYEGEFYNYLARLEKQ